MTKEVRWHRRSPAEQLVYWSDKLITEGGRTDPPNATMMAAGTALGMMVDDLGPLLRMEAKARRLAARGEWRLAPCDLWEKCGHEPDCPPECKAEHSRPVPAWEVAWAPKGQWGNPLVTSVQRRRTIPEAIESMYEISTPDRSGSLADNVWRARLDRQFAQEREASARAREEQARRGRS